MTNRLKYRPRDRNVRALAANIYQSITKITKAATINPNVLRIRLDLDAINVVPDSPLEG